MELHQIIGAFLAGMFFHPKMADPTIYERVEEQMSGLTRGFLAPIFFVSMGFHLDFSSISQVSGFVVTLTLLVGVGMSGRGAVELIIAGVALEAALFLQPDPPGAIVQGLFSAIVIMAMITTVATPVALRLFWKKKQH